MRSTVMKYPQTLNLLPILALACLSIAISASFSVRPVLTGPDKAFLSSKVAFRCVVPNSTSPVTYELVRNSSVLIDTDTDIEGDQPVVFLLKVTKAVEGSYHCNATTGGSTRLSNSIKLDVVTPPSNTRVTSEPFPPATYEGSRFVLSCDAATGSQLSYTWFFNQKKVKSSPSSFLHLTGNKLVIRNATLQHAGFYSCTAWSKVQDTMRFSSSREVQLTVKVYVSKPRISFSIYKEGDGYHGNVTCWSSIGSPPANFCLSVDDKEGGCFTAAESLATWFSVAIVPGLNKAVTRCRVRTEVQELMSEPVTLGVVPVGGEVKVEVEYLYRANSELAAARLSCRVGRGTFPHFSWLLNDSVLPSETHEDSHIQLVLAHYALADQRRTLFLTILGPEESGYYRCRVRNSYNDSGPWVESAAILVKVTEVPMTTIETIIIMFCCFLLLMLALGVCCMCKIIDQANVCVATSNSESLPASASTHRSGRTGDESPSADYHVQDQTTEVTV